MNRPLVSILIRTKDRPETLAQAITSVLAQSYRPIQLVVVNDGGQEISPEHGRLASEAGIEFVYRSLSPAQGRSPAANMALETATGQWLMFLDDDDLILPDHVETLLQLASQQPEALGAYADVQCVRFEAGKMLLLSGRYDHDFDPLRLATENFLPIHAVLFHRRVVDEGCRIDKSLNIYEDWHFWLQVTRLGRLLHRPQLGAYYRVDCSGVGEPGSNRDFSADLIAFMHAAKPLWSDDQLLHLMRSVHNLQACQQLLTERSKMRDEEQRAVSRLEDHLQDLAGKLDTRFVQLESCLQDLSGESDKRFMQLESYPQNLSDESDKQVERLAGHIRNLADVTDKRFVQMEMHLQSLVAKTDEQAVQLESQSRRLAEVQQQLAQTRAELDELKSLKLVRLNIRLRDALIYSRSRRSLWLRRGRTFFSLLRAGEFREIVSRGQRLIETGSEPASGAVPRAVRSLEDGVVILATKHTLFVARLVQETLGYFGCHQVTILDQQPASYSDGLHIVICPQMFSALPSVYISFQMEQSVSSRWLTPDYLRTLEHSLAILDYSLTNIRFLQEQGLSYRQIFWAPVSTITDFYPQQDEPVEPEYDVVFYGDRYNARREAFLDAIGARFRLLIVSEVFGEELYVQLRRARVVVNIHYYEQALLETTRVFECLSLGLDVVSEESSDMMEHEQLRPFVAFSPVGDIPALLVALEQRLQAPRPASPARLPTDLSHFRYYFGRMLAAMDLIPFECLLPVELLTANQLRRGVGLSLPETYERFDRFRNGHPELAVFHGLRHWHGWIGCAMSFKYLCHHALQQQLPSLEIYEDDVLMDDGFKEQRAAIRQYLFEGDGKGRWDIFCGLIADVSDQTQILDVVQHGDLQLVTIDRMTSMVYNIYGPNAMQAIAAWSPEDRDVHANTIDRYLQQRARLRVVTVLPFCVGHRSELSSTLWNFQNSTYDTMIIESQQRLETKVAQFLAGRAVRRRA